MTLYFDARYSGNHGIARYATEIYRASRLPRTDLLPQGRNGSFRDIFGSSRSRPGALDLVYSPGFYAGASRARHLLTLHDLTHFRGTGRRSWAMKAYYEAIVRPHIRRMGTVLTVSQTSADDLDAWLGGRIEIVNTGNGCSALFTSQGVVHRRPRPYFLYVGNLKDHKNPEDAFGAMRSFPGHDLVVVTGDAAGARRAAESFGVASQVEIMSNVEDVLLTQLYRGSEALLFPSLWEGFGLPVIEALRCGTRVVFNEAADSVAEICGGTQYSAPRGPGEFSAAIRRALSGDFREPSHLENYSWSKVVEVVDGTIGRYL